MLDKRTETKMVRAALIKANFRVRKVGHGTGTASGWLKIYLHPDEWPREREATFLVQNLTGRHGEYDGRIIVLCL